MKKRKVWRRATFALLIASIVLVSSCEKIKLSWPPWRRYEKKTDSDTAGYDWPRWRGPDGDGISQETDWNPKALTGNLKILWKKDVGTGYSNVVVKANRLYTMGRVDRMFTFYCLNAGTGKVIWEKKLLKSGWEPEATPTIDGDRVYALGQDGKMFCLRAANGKVLWKKVLSDDFQLRRPTHGLASSPVVEGELLLINANSAGIALDKKTGNLVWTIDDTIPTGSWGTYATTVVCEFKGSRYALFLGPSALNAVEVTTGKKLWSYPHNDRLHPISDPIAFDNKVFIQLMNSCTLLEMAETKPRILWSNTSLCNASMPTLVLVDGYLYGSHWPSKYFVNGDDWARMRSLDMPFRCVDWKTGKVMWETSMKTVSIIAANGKLIMLDVNGILHIAEATSSSYRELSRADIFKDEKKPRVFATYPVLCSGKIYIRNYAGDLICIDVRK
jgi:outer membrane protein assembly factor BamB